MPIESTDSEKSFVDTNLFAYAEDRRELVKRPKAISLIKLLTDECRMVISTQVINELCAILLRGKAGGVTSEGALVSLVERMEEAAEIVVVTISVTREAIRGFYTYSMSWYDALIWAAAKAAGCKILYTEDLPGMPEIEGVRYINPFAVESAI
jgi:predicted nucleic acid-binding protein